jgi:hypothetical protein
VIRDTLIVNQSSNLLGFKKNNLVETLLEVEPKIVDFKRTDKIEYSRVYSHLNIKTFNQILSDKVVFCKTEDLDNYFTYKYKEKPKIYISKSTGRFYAEEDNSETQRQAFILARIMIQYGYLENPKRTQKANKTYRF